MQPFSRRTALQTALAAGAAGALSTLAVQARAEGSSTPNPHLPKNQFRAMWIATVVNIDWPSKAGLTAAQQYDELIGYLDLAVAQNHNAVVLQVRPTADAFWPSDLEPWSRYLTGVQGKDPGWDPLGTAVAQAHARGLQLHAWFNPYRVAMVEDPSTLIASHPARQHPDWVLPYGGKLYYNPGIPEVRHFVVATIMDAVRKYDLDAVHFDDYFYPYPVAGKVFGDAATHAEYGAGQNLADWRRANINAFMTELRAEMKAVRPGCVLGVSPFAIWRNQSTDPAGSATQGGVQTYDDLAADTRMWAQTGLVDYIAPQIYWTRGFTIADYNVLTLWWADVVRGHDCNLFIGEALYKVGTASDPNWLKPDELSSHLELDSTIPEIKGNIWYSAKWIPLNVLGGIGLATATWYSKQALSPRYPWRDDQAPAPVQLTRVGGGVLRWKVKDPSTFLVGIYRVPKRGSAAAISTDMTNLVAVVPASAGEYTVGAANPSSATWVVTAIDRLGNESAADLAQG